ncbi:hypothetical protein TIFTF001_021769 [Ficus carica]|uniref:Uncharacterized protein n=1 Tax=Ficus carica TaxID=3494 RepID=A0AA88ASY9_FICCA|nr:hypothetical protein TIFTF001_021769 [Ficus carica]
MIISVDVVSMVGCERCDSGRGDGGVRQQFEVGRNQFRTSRRWVKSQPVDVWVAPLGWIRLSFYTADSPSTTWLCRRLAACHGFSLSSVNKLLAIMEVLSP